jgi:hypothetical protein|tara:strand:+ start:216 stop:1226 length:1011 start_codon:yes stop_codon:yes gene_type:complete
MRLTELQEGMGGSSGGGTPGSGGAGGSSLGLPYPSTYDEENDKFKYRSPVQRQMSLTTEDEQGEMFTDHQKMIEMMDEKNWPQDLQQEVLKKYVSNIDQGENFILDMEYKGLRRLDNYGLLQNTDNLQLITRLPQNIINKINETWQMSIPKTQATSVSDLGYEKYIMQFGFLTKPAVAMDADIIMGTEKWVASIINGEKAKQCHILSPQGPGVKSNQPDNSLAPNRQRELAFVEDKHWARDDLPQLNIDDLKDEDIEETYMPFAKLKPVQTERVKGLKEKTKKMIRKGKHKPIVVDEKGYIVNGHHRYDAYEDLGTTYVPVIKVNTSIEELIDKYM